MKMHLLVCTLAMLFTQRCCNMIVQTVELRMYLKFNVKYLYFTELSTFSYFSLGLRVQI
jgi:hypothetical protein